MCIVSATPTTQQITALYNDIQKYIWLNVRQLPRRPLVDLWIIINKWWRWQVWEAKGFKTNLPGSGVIIYECTLLNLACSPTRVSDGLDEKRGCAWLATHAICCITSGLLRTFGASHWIMTFRPGLSPLHESTLHAFFWKIFYYGTLLFFRGISGDLWAATVSQGHDHISFQQEQITHTHTHKHTLTHRTLLGNGCPPRSAPAVPKHR